MRTEEKGHEQRNTCAGSTPKVRPGSPPSCSPARPIPRLTHHGEVDLGLPAAQFVLHQQGVAAAVLLARARMVSLLPCSLFSTFDVLVLDLGAESGAGAGDLSQKGRGLQARNTPKQMQLEQGAGLVCTSGLPLRAPSPESRAKLLRQGPDLGRQGE